MSLALASCTTAAGVSITPHRYCSDLTVLSSSVLAHLSSFITPCGGGGLHSRVTQARRF